ncbi:MAG TPA: tryptophan-rich sensory protein [Acetivibrio sp.]|uniref:TspO/MBR family protein n=1 Tax=Acetivibrio sp. TaxID=1872092 RepID=UPI002B690F43|nr:tryptophan-rich sensory protein [Acetivibrio sp.]HOM02942.1 tryptophan-rich sensory protein [Acetivibrio sp.]
MEENMEGKIESNLENNGDGSVENSSEAPGEIRMDSSMENSSVSTFTKVHTTVSFIVMVFVSFLANAIPFNKMTTGEISELYPNLFAPAGMAFLIWRVIYLLLAAYTIYQFGFLKKNDRVFSKDLIEHIGVFFSISSIANTAWIFAWHYNAISMSLILIAITLICLIYINLKLRKANLASIEKLFLRLPFSIYFGWITMAAIANTITFLSSIQWNWFGISESIYTTLVLIVTLLVCGIIIFKNQDFAYGLSIIWAFIGILIRHTSDSGFGGKYPGIIIVLIVSIVLLLITDVYILVSDKEKLKSFKLIKRLK